jgi:hypothetical protein
MKILLLIIAVFTVTACYCQNADIYKRKPWEDTKLKNLYRNQLQYNNPLKRNSITISDSNKITMPVLRFELSKRYLGSNGKGADVYAMMPYNMPCLTPDSTFKSNMPVMSFNNKVLPKGR